MKTCRKCKQPKPETDFAIQKQNRDGRHATCKACYNAVAKVRYRSSPEHLHAIRARARAYRVAHPDLFLNSKLKVTFGIGLDVYNQMLNQQNGRCKICNQPPTRHRLGVDHDHITGRVRGLLCGNCNTLLGMAHDSPDILQSAICYLTAEFDPWIGAISDEEIMLRSNFFAA